VEGEQCILLLLQKHQEVSGFAMEKPENAIIAVTIKCQTAAAWQSV